MNNSSVDLMLEQIGVTLGIGDVVFPIMASCFIVMSFIFIYARSRNMTVSLAVANISGVVFAVMGMLPIYTIVLLIAVSFFIIWKYAQKGEDIITYPESYRDRMIRAYEAKFGGGNPAFNERLDSHIKAVESLRKGYTRSVHMDALKRLERFVEAKS